MCVCVCRRFPRRSTTKKAIPLVHIIAYVAFRSFPHAVEIPGAGLKISLPRHEPHSISHSTHLTHEQFPSPNLSRGLAAPDTLQEAISLRQTVQAVVALGPRPHESAECVDLVLTGVAAVLVNLADADLDAGVVFGLDDAVGGAAFAGT